MVKKTKCLSCILFLLFLMFLFSSCVVDTNLADESTTGTVKSTTTSAPEAAAQKGPTPISLFYQEAGQSFPKDFSHKDNWFMKALCEMANVEITELTVPAYSETEAKFNLMMASGNIPNLVERASVTQMKQYGMEGAFIPTENIIKKSAILGPMYDDIMLEVMKSSDGVSYIIQSMPINGDFSTVYVRYDFLQDVGISEIPLTLDKTLDAMREVKKKYPDKIMLSGAGLRYTDYIFKAYNTTYSGYIYREDEGVAKNIFEEDNIVGAVRLGKMLYDEGLLDQEFMTNSVTDYKEKRLRAGLFLTNANRGGMTIIMQQFLNDGQLEARLIPMPYPIAEEAGVTEYKTNPNVLGTYAFGISKKSSDEEIEGCTRFIEALYSDECKEMFEYGREGIEYKMVNKEPMPILPAAGDTAWRSLYGLAFSTNTDNVLSYGAKQNIYVSSLNDSDKDSYWDLYNTNTLKCLNLQRESMTYSPVSLAKPIPDESLNRSSEMSTLQESLIAKAIIGEISIDEFLVQKDQVVKDYKDVIDAYNVVIAEAKDKFGLK